jgi:2-C-methyl-D-erythritol 2,4-cyclodiphosphate synthase
MTQPQMRIGQGWDVHALVPGRRLVIGGIHIPYHLGLLGHSDADVLLHAVIDAMLGAAGLGDIGAHFPDTDERWKNADSLKLLSACAALLKDKGWRVHNLDSTVIAQAPKLAPHIHAMREQIAGALSLDIALVNIKAKTAEKLGPVGQGQSIEAQAIVLLCSAD